MSTPASVGRHRWRGALRRALPLLLLIPLAYAVRPLFWAPLDLRFYDQYLAEWRGDPPQDVVVVGIDSRTRQSMGWKPVNPLSRHVSDHARLVRCLDEAGARAIVLDLTLSNEDIADTDSSLVRSIDASKRVYLIAYVEEESSAGQITRRPRLPASALLRASRGAFSADISLDQDGVLRRFSSDERAAEFGIKTLPECLADTSVPRPIPIVFPSREDPLPAVSYQDVLNRTPAAWSAVRGKVAFVGRTEDPLSDFVPAPFIQKLGEREERGLPGVAALAVITETLFRGCPLKDASWPEILAWNVLWCLVLVLLLPRYRPWWGLAVVAGVMLVAVTVTGLLQIHAGLIFPAGLLAGCLFVSGSYAVIASHVETARRLHAEEAERRRVHRELETARGIQQALLPATHPSLPGWDIWGTNISSQEVSGDYYDMILADDKRTLWLIIADVSGKGMPASLIMSNVHAALQSRLRGGTDDLGAVATDLGQYLHAHTPPESFVTMFLAALDIESRRLRFVSAGHEPPLLLTAALQWRECETAGPPLGAMHGISYASSETRLDPGDRLVLYTDGVTEAMNAAEEMYQVGRLRAVVLANAANSSQELGEAVLSSVREFVGSEACSDDITLVVVKSLPIEI